MTEQSKPSDRTIDEKFKALLEYNHRVVVTDENDGLFRIWLFPKGHQLTPSVQCTEPEESLSDLLDYALDIFEGRKPWPDEWSDNVSQSTKFMVVEKARDLIKKGTAPERVAQLCHTKLDVIARWEDEYVKYHAKMGEHDV